jgi:hypothetical protein
MFSFSFARGTYIQYNTYDLTTLTEPKSDYLSYPRETPDGVRDRARAGFALNAGILAFKRIKSDPLFFLNSEYYYLVCFLGIRYFSQRPLQSDVEIIPRRKSRCVPRIN